MTIGLVFFALINFHERKWREKKLNSPKSRSCPVSLTLWFLPDIIHSHFKIFGAWHANCKPTWSLTVRSPIAILSWLRKPVIDPVPYWMAKEVPANKTHHHQPCIKLSSSNIVLQFFCTDIIMCGLRRSWNWFTKFFVCTSLCGLWIRSWNWFTKFLSGHHHVDFEDLMKLFYKFFVWTLKIMNHEYCYWNLWEKNFGSWLLVLQQQSINQSIDQSILELEEF
jgi:hypothetical protein